MTRAVTAALANRTRWIGVAAATLGSGRLRHPGRPQGPRLAPQPSVRGGATHEIRGAANSVPTDHVPITLEIDHAVADVGAKGLAA